MLMSLKFSFILPKIFIANNLERIFLLVKAINKLYTQKIKTQKFLMCKKEISQLKIQLFVKISLSQIKNLKGSFLSKIEFVHVICFAFLVVVFIIDSEIRVLTP